MKEEYLQRSTNALERISLVLGALYADKLGDYELGVKAKKLNCCGFTNTEIAKLLGTTPNNINVALHRHRTSKKKKKKKKK